MKKVNIGILGLGTVGGGTYDILRDNRSVITKRTGVDYEVTRILEIKPSYRRRICEKERSFHKKSF